MRPTQYLLRDEGYGAEVVAGPIPAFDDEQFEDVLIGFLKDHPWDDTVLYQCLLIDEKGNPSIEVFMDDYLEPLLGEAWGFNLPESDDPSDEAEENEQFKALADMQNEGGPHDEDYPTDPWD